MTIKEINESGMRNSYTVAELEALTDPSNDIVYHTRENDTTTPDSINIINERYDFSGEAAVTSSGGNVVFDYFSIKNHTLADPVGSSSARRIITRRDGTGVVYYIPTQKKLITALYRTSPTSGWQNLAITLPEAHHNALMEKHNLEMKFDYIFDEYPKITVKINDMSPIIRNALRGYTHSRMISGVFYGKTMESLVVSSAENGIAVDTKAVTIKGDYLSSFIRAGDKFEQISDDRDILYFGDADIDGSMRIRKDGDTMGFEIRSSGSWLRMGFFSL